MAGSFHGAAVVMLDAKGRLSIPTRYRDALREEGGRLVVSAHPEGCGLLYPESGWEAIKTQVENFPAFHAQASWWKRLLLGFEEHVTPDGSGRILISVALRMHARLEREVMMVGQGGYFELWDSAVWSTKLSAALSEKGGPPPGMEEFSL